EPGRGVEAVGGDIFECLHAAPPFSARAARIFAGVIGRLRTRTPIALAIALATGPAVGTTGGSPMARTPRSSPFRQMIGMISGQSTGPSTLYISRLGLPM